MNDFCPLCGYVPVTKKDESGYSITRCTSCSSILKKEPATNKKMTKSKN